MLFWQKRLVQGYSKVFVIVDFRKTLPELVRVLCWLLFHLIPFKLHNATFLVVYNYFILNAPPTDEPANQLCAADIINQYC